MIFLHRCYAVREEDETLTSELKLYTEKNSQLIEVKKDVILLHLLNLHRQQTNDPLELYAFTEQEYHGMILSTVFSCN